MQTEQLNIKLQPALLREIDLISKILHIPKNEWARGVLAAEVKRKLDEHRVALLREYFKGAVTRKELVQVIGEAEVRGIDRLAATGKAGLADASKLAKSEARPEKFSRSRSSSLR